MIKKEVIRGDGNEGGEKNGWVWNGNGMEGYGRGGKAKYEYLNSNVKLKMRSPTNSSLLPYC